MSRRTATLVLTGVLLLALVSLAWIVPVPYVTMSPGPTANVLGKVEGQRLLTIDGYEVYQTNGRLDLTTVKATSASKRLELPEALGAWADPRVAVVPRDYLYPENTTPEQVEQVNAQLMDASQQDAVAAALRLAGKEVHASVVVHAVVDGMPADGKLRPGDAILQVDGKSVDEPEEVGAQVTEHKPGKSDPVRFTVVRDGETVDVTVPTERSEDNPDKPMVGIQVAMGYRYSGSVEIDLAQQIGGPSAGGMFALAIYDRLEPGSLTGGKHIAGTGTIDAKGNIGPIGGIQQKVAGAADAGATVFLVPEKNCAAAVEMGIDGLRLVRIETLSDAVDALQAMNDGRAADVPRCEQQK